MVVAVWWWMLFVSFNNNTKVLKETSKLSSQYLPFIFYTQHILAVAHCYNRFAEIIRISCSLGHGQKYLSL